MSARGRALSLRLGLALAAFAGLAFFKPLEDAYTLPQGVFLALAGLGLLLGTAGERPPWTPVFGLGLGLWAWRGFCHFASPDAPAQGAWLAVQVPQLALFVGTALALRKAEARRRFAAALLAAGALGAAYALLGPLGWDPFASGAVDLGFARRAHGSLGNPDFLAGWLALLLPLGLACLARASARTRAWVGLGLGLMLLALLLTLARGAWLAAGAGCAVAWARLGWRPSRRALLAWGLGAAGAGAVLLALGPGLSGLAGRLSEAATPGSDAWASRAFMGGVALDLAREHPLLGVGPGAFEVEYLRRQGERLWDERGQPFRLTADAHDDWLQAAAETGFPGLLLWAALFALALAAAWRRGGAEGAACAGALAAFGVQGCFHFPWDIVPSAGLACAALGLAAGFGERTRAGAAERGPAPAPDGFGSGDGADPRPSRRSGSPGARAWTWLAVPALCACLLLDLRAAAASAFLNSGSAFEQGSLGQRRLAAVLLAEAARLGPGDERAWSRLGLVQMGLGSPKEAEASFRAALKVLPSDPNDWTDLGLCLGQDGRPREAAACLREAVRLDPRSNEAWSDLAKAEALLGDTGGALDAARRGIAQAGGSAQAWFNLGALLYDAGRRSQAAPAFAAALRLDPRDSQARSLLRECLRAP